MHRVSNVFIPCVLTPRECNGFVEAVCTQLPAVNADMGVNKDFPEVRSSTVRWIYKSQFGFEWIFNRILPIVFSANANSFGFQLDDLDAFQFTSYTGDRLGHYGDHIDLFLVSDSEKDRKLSFVIQLSNPLAYVGGDLRIHCDNHPNPTEMRLQGSMVMFASFLQHGVSPVTYGLRHSLVGWASGDRLR